MVNNAVEIKLHAKAKAKQMVDEGQKTGIATHGGNRKEQGHKAVTLKEVGDNQHRGTPKASRTDIGITYNESSDWQKLAKVPEKKLVEV